MGADKIFHRPGNSTPLLTMNGIQGFLKGHSLFYLNRNQSIFLARDDINLSNRLSKTALNDVISREA